MTTSGIYAITNTESGKVYIGSTKYLKRRRGEHKNALQQNKHGNPHLQAAWNKYGENAFEFSVLEEVDNIDNLYPVEQFWMDKYREEGKDLYNVALAADSPMRGRVMPQEQRDRISRTCIGREFTKEHKYRISEANMGRLGGFSGKEHTEETKHKMLGNQNAVKPYPAFTYEETGEILPAGINLTAMCRRRGLDPCNMLNVAHGGVRICKGWILAEAHLRDCNYNRKVLF